MSNVSRDVSYSFVWPGDYNWGNAASYPLPRPPLGESGNFTAAKLTVGHIGQGSPKSSNLVAGFIGLAK
ncbi:hypothetical protein M8J75_012710 [Diaphorina citri]|nr:hypothetical protein M8J75_012710 [Diaphorina citri]